MTRILLGVIALALVGCTADGSYIGPARPIDGSFSTLTLDFKGRSSAYKSDERPIGYLGEGQECYSTYNSSADGSVAATCIAAEISACGADADCIRAARE